MFYGMKSCHYKNFAILTVFGLPIIRKLIERTEIERTVHFYEDIPTNMQPASCFGVRY
jgi:hypothetical protein